MVVQKLSVSRPDFAPITLDTISDFYEMFEDMQRSTRRMLATIGIEYYLGGPYITFVIGGQWGRKKQVRKTQEMLGQRVQALGYISSELHP